jgi:hypothetical protein
MFASLGLLDEELDEMHANEERNCSSEDNSINTAKVEAPL